MLRERANYCMSAPRDVERWGKRRGNGKEGAQPRIADWPGLPGFDFANTWCVNMRLLNVGAACVHPVDKAI